MHKLRLISSSHQRRLAQALADDLQASPSPPLEQETVIVLSNGMSRWLSMELAAIHGVSAGLDFRFPNDLLDSCFRALTPQVQPSSAYVPETMTWRIASILPEMSEKPGFEQISHYLGDQKDDRRLMQLSRSLADVFDQYTIFRPEMIIEWDQGLDDDWQAQLWRAISTGISGRHRAAQLHEIGMAIKSNESILSVLPRRISIFGISYLPPFHLEALRILSEQIQVNCYLYNPCGLYWGNLVSEKVKTRLALSNQFTEAQQYYETGNPLLSSLGTLGQEFFETMLDYGFECEELDVHGPTDPALQEPDNCTLLTAIQNDILNLKDSTTAENKSVIADADRSIQIHSCHSPMREMEILYDNLLAMFDKLPDLEARQILVMIPDIETYAPYISSVFGNHSGSRPPLSFTIADRSFRRENPYVEAFLKVLDIVSGRFGINETLNLLEMPSVAARFEINDEELSEIRSWSAKSGVRWGLDAAHRLALGFPEYGDYSWQTGLDRLFMGYAVNPADSKTFKGILPYSATEGRQALPLGKLANFIFNLRSLHNMFTGRKKLQEWAALLTSTVEMMTRDKDLDSSGSIAVARAINSLLEAQSSGGFNKPLSLEAVRDCLKQRLAKPGGGFGFMGGSITFCAMLPMRSIPMRVVCLAGMNDGVFPRTSNQPAFSLMSGARRRGDRSLRDEDRYLFLEAIMSAKDCFYISYNGQSDRDNSSIPPSVLVSELQDYINSGFVNSQKSRSPDILTIHRLQGFSSAYFDVSGSSRLFSYDQEICQAIEARRCSGISRYSFIETPLPEQTDRLQTVTVDQLRRFLLNPSAAFLLNRIKISPFNPADEPDEREPFSMDGLTGYSLSQVLVSLILQNKSRELCFDTVRSSGMLPPMPAGRAVFDTAWLKCNSFAATIALRTGTRLERLTIELDIDEHKIAGHLDGINCGTNLRWRCAGLRGKDRLSLWLDHLLLNALQPEGYPRESVMVAKDIVLTFAPLENATAHLANLLNLYKQGMQQPLPFFPQTSWDYFEGGGALAAKSWAGDKRISIPGDSDDPAVSICFGSDEPFGDRFSELAGQVYLPLKKAIASELKLL